MAAYDLWDVEPGKMIGVFDTETDAPRVVAQLLAGNGLDRTEAIDLDPLDDQGNTPAKVAAG